MYSVLLHEFLDVYLNTTIPDAEIMIPGYKKKWETYTLLAYSSTIDLTISTIEYARSFQMGHFRITSHVHEMKRRFFLNK